MALYECDVPPDLAGELRVRLDFDEERLLIRRIRLSAGRRPGGEEKDAPPDEIRWVSEEIYRTLAGHRPRPLSPRIRSMLPPPFDDVRSKAARTLFVLREQVHFGATITYGELARFIYGTPRAARAVGAIMAANPCPILFPCHRVVAAVGAGGFSCGVELKKLLLAREARMREG